MMSARNVPRVIQHVGAAYPFNARYDEFVGTRSFFTQMEHPAWCTFFLFTTKKLIIYASLVVFDVGTRWSFALPAAGACRRLNRIISSLAESHFALFSFSRPRPGAALLSSLVPVAISRHLVPCAFGTIDIPSRAHSQRVDSTRASCGSVRRSRARRGTLMSFCDRRASADRGILRELSSRESESA